VSAFTTLSRIRLMPKTDPLRTTKNLARRDRLLQRDILRLAIVRKSLHTLATSIAQLESHEVVPAIETLRDELQQLLNANSTSLAWRQVTKRLNDLDKYGLSRLGLLPLDTDDSTPQTVVTGTRSSEPSDNI
jgi:hypothetical protein